MPKKRTSRAGIAKKPATPKCVFVDLVSNDFFALSTGEPNGPQTIAVADAFNELLGGAPNIDFNASDLQNGYFGAKATIDIVPEMQQMGMAWISSVYIDCQVSPGVFLLRHAPTRLTIVVPPFTQGWFPMLIPEGSNHSFDAVYIDPASGTGNAAYGLPNWSLHDTTGYGDGGNTFVANIGVESGAIRLQFTDVLVPPCHWRTRNNDQGYWVDNSGTITTGGTFQDCSTFSSFRKAIMIVNCSTTEVLYVYPFTTTPGGPTIKNTIPLAPGATYLEKWPCVSLNTFQVMGNTAGHPYMCRELF